MMQGQIPAPPEIPPLPFDPNLFLLNDGGPPAIVMIVFLALLAATVILWPVMRALARSWTGKVPPIPRCRLKSSSFTAGSARWTCCISG